VQQDILSKTWRLQEPFHALHAKLMTLVSRGPAMTTAYSVLAGRIDDAQMNQLMKVHHFTLGLRPSLRPPVLDRKFVSLPLAVAFVLQRDATRSLAGAGPSAPGAGPVADGNAPMDIDVNSVALTYMSAEDREACMRALGDSSSGSSSSQSASVSAASSPGPLTAADVAGIVAAQLAAAGLGSGARSKPDKSRSRPSPSSSPAPRMRFPSRCTTRARSTASAASAAPRRTRRVATAITPARARRRWTRFAGRRA
jgi:hypothetical protein